MSQDSNEKAAERSWRKAMTDRHFRAAWAVLAGIVDKHDAMGVLNIVDSEWSELNQDQRTRLGAIHGDGSLTVVL